jgi:hypothetical protein
MPSANPNNKPASMNQGSVFSQLSICRPAQKPKITEAASSIPIVPTNAKARKGPSFPFFKSSPSQIRFYILSILVKKNLTKIVKYS